MRRRCACWFLGLSVWFGVVTGLAAAPVVDPKADQALGRAWRKIEAQPANQGVRELFEFALEAAAVGWHPERVEAVLRQAAALQDRDSARKTRGNFRWYRNQAKPKDLNAVEFCLQRAVLLWLHHQEVLTEPARRELATLLREAVAGVRGHRVPVDYTNIFLMKTWNCIALGAALGDPELTALGERQLDEWLAYTRVNGIHEFLSPTYSGVDADSLALLQRYAPSSAVREKAAAGLTLLWLQTAANWFAPAARLGGAHSRDYNYLTGRGYFDQHLAAWGWVPPTTNPLHAFAEAARWVPASPWPDLPLPRTVWQRWGDGPGMWATTYVGRSFCLGTSGASYNTDDKVLTIQFPGGSEAVMGNLVTDGRGDPYGQAKEPDNNGHAKALHLLPFVASVQAGADALIACSFDPAQTINRRAAAPTRQLAMNLVLPDTAEVWNGEERLAIAAGEAVTLAGDRPIHVRVQDVVIALRVLDATDCQGGPVSARLVRDGAAWHAMRLVWEQSSGPATGEAHLVLWLHGAEGVDDGAFAALRATLADATTRVVWKAPEIEAVVAMPSGPSLSLQANLKTGERHVSPASPVDQILTVNGQSLPALAGLTL